MNDPSLSLLLQAAINASQTSEREMVWVADEQNAPALEVLSQIKDRVTLFSNRINIANQATALGIRTVFNDLRITEPYLAESTRENTNTEKVQNVFIRVSKERAVVNHCINQAGQILSPNGTLFLSGEKGEGIKGYIDKASKLLSARNSVTKNGSAYLGVIHKNTLIPEKYLDDKDYHQIRAIGSLDEHDILSKPGVYGWQKIDEGSQLLFNTFQSWISEHGGEKNQYRHFLDLGCGYGYLTLATHEYPFETRTATDNNAAAILCAQANTDNFQIPTRVIADDCGNELPAKHYDLILCNPPFHTGFATDGDLTTQFLTQASRLLKSSGDAFFVVNSFIPLETKAKNFFLQIETLYNNKQFKVLRLSKPQH